MSTIRIAVDDELADGIEEFFKARGIEFGGENIIRATDHSKPTKPRPKFYDVVNTSIKSFAKVLSEYLDGRGVSVEIDTNDETIIRESKDSTDKVETFIHKHSKFRFYIKIKP
jgi:hypothetical protein